MFSVLLSNKAEKQLRALDAKILERAKRLFGDLEQNPVPAKDYDIVKIAGEKSAYRIRLSSFRVVYCVFWEEKIIRITKVELRSETTY